MGLKESNWVIYLVNNNMDPEAGNGGTRKSPQLFRKDNKYLHFHLMKNMDELHANKINETLIDMNSLGKDVQLPQYEDVQCER